MKKLFLYSSFLGMALLGSSTLVSCDRVQDAVNAVADNFPFNVPLNINQPKAPLFTASTAGEMWDYGKISLNLDVDAEIKKQNSNLGINNLRSAKLTSFQIELVDGTGINADLASISGAEIYLIAPKLPEKLVATASGNTNAKLLTFQTKSDEELIDYLKNKENSIRLKIKSEKLAAGTVNINLKPTFRIVAGV